MQAWHRWIERLYLRSLGSRDASKIPGDATLRRLLEEKERELEALRSADRERGAVHRKLHERYEALKIRHQTRGDELKKTRGENRELVRETQALRQELEHWNHRAAAGPRILSRPGLMPPLLPIDSRTEAGNRRFARLQSKVWRYPMRLGVLVQHDPVPIRRETFPAPRSPGRLPLISVVTPSYNHAAFLERTMLSILDGQPGARLEYLVCDGGSTDESAEIIRRHEDRLAGWFSEKDRGPADAINKGFRRSTGEIMTWVNSDDLWMPGAAAYAADYFARHPDVDVIYGHRIIVDEKDNEVGHWTLPPHDGGMLLWADYVPQETLFWRRSIWEKTGARLDESFQFAFDWELLLRFQRAGARIVRLPRFMGCFRCHAAQKSSADISTVGFREMARLRERELGTTFSEVTLERLVVDFQHRATWSDRLLRLGIRR